ncbi:MULTISPECIES: hypothetical protein [Methylobacterium]|uniref:hypothetical protein n=1 Tax=Methylobacterium TaxID=407 RepID=UPI002F353AA8
MLQRKRQHGLSAMIALALAALLVAVAANIALVPFVADRLSPKNTAPAAAGSTLLASNENYAAVAKIAA